MKNCAGIFITRAQPFHNGHLEVCRYVSENYKRLVVVVGSAFESPSIKNPLSLETRLNMVAAALEADGQTADIMYLGDSDYDYDEWLVRFGNLIRPLEGEEQPTVVGFNRDHSSYYLEKTGFASDILREPLHHNLSASEIRKYLFEHMQTEAPLGVIAKTVEYGDLPECYLKQAQKGNPKFITELSAMAAEWAFIQEYKKKHGGKKDGGPLEYPPTYVAGDATVYCNGCVLMILRGRNPGKDQYAVPGGFLTADKDASVQEASLRELVEETHINVSKPKLQSCITNQRVFDAIDRDPRGRFISHNFFYDLTPLFPHGTFPEVRADDDASQIFWIKVSDIDSIRTRCFTDHAHMVKWFLNRRVAR